MMNMMKMTWLCTVVYAYVCGQQKQQDWTKCSFAGQLAIKAAEGNAECLYGTQRVVVIHCKDIFRDTTKLHHNVVHYTHTQRYISNKVLLCNASANFDCIPKVLLENMSDHMQWLVWLAEHNSNVCSECQGPMSLNRCQESSDNFSWKCWGCKHWIFVHKLWPQY